MFCDVLIVGAGASGIMAAIAASKPATTVNNLHPKVVVCEHMKTLGLKLLASGGGRGNITNNLNEDDFMASFGKFGRFMKPALFIMGSLQLKNLFLEIGVETNSPDGFRVWPKTHNASTIVNALSDKLAQHNVALFTETKVLKITKNLNDLFEIATSQKTFTAKKVIVATGGLSYQTLGATGDGYTFAKAAGHKIVTTVPAGVRLVTKEKWPGSLTANTIGKAFLQVNLKKYYKIQGTGDLIFTTDGITGPAALNLSGDISLLLTKYKEVPVYLYLDRKKSKQDWQQIIKLWKTSEHLKETVVSLLNHYLPLNLCTVVCKQLNISTKITAEKLSGEHVNKLCDFVTKIPLTIIGTKGYNAAFVTKGGISLKNIDPKTMESKLLKGLYFCGEVLDLNGPCGGFNLQWAFASGYLAGLNKED